MRCVHRSNGYPLWMVGIIFLNLMVQGVPQASGFEAVTFQRLLDAPKDPQNWLMYLGTYNAWRYSSLDQIHRKNVGNLVPVWAFQPGVNDFEATPLVVDGVMFVSSSYNRVFALDAATGREIWHYYYQYQKHPKTLEVPYKPYNRGVAVGYDKVYMGTLDNHLVALEAQTGKEVWNIEVEDPSVCGCNITSPPLVVKDKVLVGATGGELATRGYIDAYEAGTGKRVWRFLTVPGPGEPGNETWGGDSWKYGGGSSWLVGSYDPELDLVYWGIGNPAPAFDGDVRPGDNLYTNSVVALHPDTGALKWYFQEVPHDVWDFDAAYESVLLDVEKEGQVQKLLLHTNKNGFVYVLDRTDGKFITAWPLVKTLNWATGIDAEGKPIGRKELPPGVPTLICPGLGGGRDWNHGAYSPRTGLYYTTGVEYCLQVTVKREKPVQGKIYMGADFPQTMYKPAEDSHGHLDAYEPLTGKARWSYRTKYPLLSSILATGGDLIFTGDIEGYFLAFDAETGEKLWSFNTGSGHRGSAISYAVNGRQYIAVPSGFGSLQARHLHHIWPETKDFRSGATLFVFALPD